MESFYTLPRLLMTSCLNAEGVLLMDKIDGEVFSSFLNIAQLGKCALVEDRRLSLFMSCVDKTAVIKTVDIRKLKCSHILWNRLESGNRYTEFYEKSLRLKDFQHKAIFINGKSYHKTIDQIVSEMRERVLSSFLVTSLCIFGHCDSHRGNIFVENSSGDPVFIDTEYAEEDVPIEVEICKSYYNDLYGFLFFSEPEKLYDMYNCKNVLFDQGSLFIEDFYEKDSEVLGFLKNKSESLLKTSKEKCHKSGIEFNSRFFKDLLLICHLLTKNPETYTEEAFTIFIKVLIDIEEMEV